ncbi:MAG: hypothetical protein PW734_02325 [Verrucomicrobium sp.]|nr:hypothetical protein [Verrucomicrobium sp.]
MIDYAEINRRALDIVPKREVLYLSGPMSHCKSEAHMTEIDQNFAMFNAMEAHFTARGHRVLNPARIEACLRDDPEAQADPTRLWQACLKKDLYAMIHVGVTRIVFLPPAHTAHSTLEKPHLRSWEDSSGACLEVFFGLKLGCAFSRAVPDGRNGWELEEMRHEEVRAILAHSQTFAELQRGYDAPFVPQGGQALVPQVRL